MGNDKGGGGVTMSLVMHLYELLACFALISSVIVCVILHPFLRVCGICQELALLQLGIWTGTSSKHAYWHRMLDRMTVGQVQIPNGPIYGRALSAVRAQCNYLGIWP